MKKSTSQASEPYLPAGFKASTDWSNRDKESGIDYDALTNQATGYNNIKFADGQKHGKHTVEKLAPSKQEPDFFDTNYKSLSKTSLDNQRKKETPDFIPSKDIIHSETELPIDADVPKCSSLVSSQLQGNISYPDQLKTNSFEVPDWNIIIQKVNSNENPVVDGCWSPKPDFCTPDEHLVVIIPYRSRH